MRLRRHHPRVEDLAARHRQPLVRLLASVDGALLYSLAASIATCARRGAKAPVDALAARTPRTQAMLVTHGTKVLPQLALVMLALAALHVAPLAGSWPIPALGESPVGALWVELPLGLLLALHVGTELGGKLWDAFTPTTA